MAKKKGCVSRLLPGSALTAPLAERHTSLLLDAACGSNCTIRGSGWSRSRTCRSESPAGS